MASNVAALVSEMNDTLTDIRQTIDALSTATHTSRLDQLEHQRDSTIAALRANFERETDDLAVKRRRERDEIAERRRQEDEEIAARRLREDDDMGAREEREDEQRERRFVGETDDVEDEMDGLMEGVETEAEITLARGRDKLEQLEERRKELNHLIDEQVRVPLPTVTTRRRSRNQRTMDAAIASKPAPAQAREEPVSNTLKATKEEHHGGYVAQPTQQAGRGALVTQGEEEERTVSGGSENASRGSFESTGARRSRTASISSSHRGSRMSAFGWIAGKIGLGEAREEDEAVHGLEQFSKPDQERVVNVVPEEVTEHSRELSGGVNAPEEGLESEERSESEQSVSNGIEESAETVLEDTSSTELTYYEIEVHNGESQPAITSETQALDNATGEVDESEGDAVAEHKNSDAPSEHQQTPEEAPHLPVEVVPSDTQDESANYDQHHEGYMAYNEGTSDTDIPHDQSTASSRAGSYVETTTAPASSEATLDVDSEPYYEQDVLQRARDKDNYGDFDPEPQVVNDIPVGEDEPNDYGVDSNGPDYASQSPVGLMEANETAVSGDISDPVLNYWSPVAPHAGDQDDAVLDGDHDDEYYGTSTNVEDVPETTFEVQTFEEPHTFSSQSLIQEDMDEAGHSAGLEPLVHDLAQPTRGLDSNPDVSLLEQKSGQSVLASEHYKEEVHQTNATSRLPNPFPTENPADSPEPSTSEAAQDLEPEEETRSLDGPREHLPIELGPHAMEYSSGPETVQLPDGTWTVGMVDEGLYESLVAQFMMPAIISSENDPLEDVSAALPIPEDEGLSASDVGDHTDTVIALPDERSGNDELLNSAYTSFAHDVQPVVVQLGNGAWSVDPSDGEFEDALALSQAPEIPMRSELRPPIVDSSENEQVRSWKESDVKSVGTDDQPVTMQLPSGAWVAGPSEEEYESAAKQIREPSEHGGHLESTIDTPNSPSVYEKPGESDAEGISDIHERNLSEDLGSSSPRVDHRPFNTESPEMSEEADASPSHRIPSAPNSDVGDQEGTISLEEAESRSEQAFPDASDEQPTYGTSQAAVHGGTSLPWSPFNSRIPLSPHSSPATAFAVHSPQLDANEVERAEDVDIVNPAGRHATFGYGKTSAEQYGSIHPDDDAPKNPGIQTDTLNITEATTDTESQNFVTPLQSAGIQTPPPFQDPPGTFHNAVDYPQSHVLQEETATTVHGQDELFDSDSASEYEPDPSVDENGDPRANLGMPPPHHALVQAEEASSTPTTAILQPEADKSAQHTPETASALEDNSDVSPLSLREAIPPPEPPRRGLAFSRHNPERPITPPAQTIPEDLGSHGGSWDASVPVDSTPMSLVSHSTLSSSPGSPVRERMPQSREPAIQNSWSEDVHGLEGDQHPHHDFEGEYETTPAQESKFDENLPTPIATHIPESVREYSPATPSPSTLIQKMRSIFENPAESSPVRSRPSSGIFNAPRPLESPGYDVPGETRKGGFLNEAEDEVDERSALLGSVARN